MQNGRWAHLQHFLNSEFPEADIIFFIFTRDAMCGMLMCTHRAERLAFWKEALSYLMPETWVTQNGRQHDCKGAILDVGLNMRDPGMVPNGSPCAENKVRHSLLTCYFDFYNTRPGPNSPFAPLSPVLGQKSLL